MDKALSAFVVAILVPATAFEVIMIVNGNSGSWIPLIICVVGIALNLRVVARHDA